MFITVVRAKSAVAGCRWDDIVMRFEYLASELPSLLGNLKESKLSQSHKDHVTKHLEQHHDLDFKGLNEVIADLELEEKSPDYT